ncbi:DUF6125 family protein [Chloroflexota bacterium]
MQELEEYSGPFRPDVKLEDFSKEALLRLFRATARQYLSIDGIWNSVIKENFGEKTARDMETEVWKRATSSEIHRTMGALNIQGDGVATVLKAIQCAPGTAGIMDFDCELKDEKHGVLTVKRCSSLEFFERHRDTEGIEFACLTLDTEVGYPETAAAVNPKMKAIPLKRPPRQSKDEICCQWEFKIEE